MEELINCPFINRHYSFESAHDCLEDVLELIGGVQAVVVLFLGPQVVSEVVPREALHVEEGNMSAITVRFIGGQREL